MTSKIKVLGLAVVAVLAMSALGASGANAAEFTSTTASTPVTGESEGHHVFDAAGTSITCGKAHFAGTQTGTSAPSIVMTATYSECKFLFVNVSVNMNGCAYRFYASGTVDVIDHTSCGGITFSGAGCHVVVPKQSNLERVTYTNVHPNVTVTPEVTGIHYTSTGCLSNGTQTNGNYTTGPTVVKATNGATISVDTP